MDQRTIQILFALLRSAICGTRLTLEEREGYSPDMLEALLKISSKHDVAHLLVVGLKQNDLMPKEHSDLEKCILKAVYRYERMQYEYERLCAVFEAANLPFLPLKGAVLRNYYPEAWMRTSCDIDILVRREDLEAAISRLVENDGYVERERATHDVSLDSPLGIHVELHFDLVEEGRAQNAIDVLRSVWDSAKLCAGSACRYEMTDAYFYFYHIAHMAKHFENGGCGIRPFLDLWILDRIEGADASAREVLLSQGGLLKFSNASQMLNKVWFDGQAPNEQTLQMQNFLLRGGVYGSTGNRVAIQQKKKGGRFGYLLSRIFVSHAKLKRYYPVLEKHRWLTPVMQIRRWFMLFRPEVAEMAKREIAANGNLEKTKSDEMNAFLDHIGLA